MTNPVRAYHLRALVMTGGIWRPALEVTSRYSSAPSVSTAQAPVPHLGNQLGEPGENQCAKIRGDDSRQGAKCSGVTTFMNYVRPRNRNKLLSLKTFFS